MSTPKRQLVEQGRLNLDDPAGKHVPEIDEMTLLDGSKPNKRITTRMLLAHTAGFSYTVSHGPAATSQLGGTDQLLPIVQVLQ
jgi:CubicO group peptidase (beta-lactamase class C family)